MIAEKSVGAPRIITEMALHGLVLYHDNATVYAVACILYVCSLLLNGWHCVVRLLMVSSYHYPNRSHIIV